MGREVRQVGYYLSLSEGDRRREQPLFACVRFEQKEAEACGLVPKKKIQGGG